MVTGYTSKLRDGKPISFAEFALECSRAFGALSQFCDGGKIPEELVPSDYHKKLYDDTIRQLKLVSSMTKDECDIEARDEYRERVQLNEQARERAEFTKKRYLDMREQVLAWEPPTKEHENLKKFMLNQIDDSMTFDTMTSHLKEPELLDGERWRQKRIKELQEGVAYHANGYRLEVERTNAKNEWLKALRESLKRYNEQRGI